MKILTFSPRSAHGRDVISQSVYDKYIVMDSVISNSLHHLRNITDDFAMAFFLQVIIK